MERRVKKKVLLAKLVPVTSDAHAPDVSDDELDCRLFGTDEHQVELSVWVEQLTAHVRFDGVVLDCVVCEKGRRI